MRASLASDVLLILGGLLIVAAAFLVSPILGIAAIGAACLLGSFLFLPPKES